MPAHKCRQSEDPRRAGYCACGAILGSPTHVKPSFTSCGQKITYGLRERDIPLERYLTSIAAQAVGHTQLKPDGTVIGDTGGLDDFADHRALPGGVRAEMDYDREIAEEIADARNYAVWGIEPIWTDVRAGESQHTSDYERRMRALSHLVAAWHALHDYGP